MSLGRRPLFGLSLNLPIGRALIDQAAADAGRDPAEVITAYNVVGVLREADLPRTRDDDGRLLGGSARQWIDELSDAVLEHGAAGLNLAVTDPDGNPDAAVAQLFADEVIPAVRAATR